MSETKRYIVEFHSQSDRNLIELVGGVVRHDYVNMPELLSAELTEFQVQELLANTHIKSVQPCGKGRSSGQIEDFGYLHTCVQDYYRGRHTGQGVKVAIVDSGVALHEDLKPVVAWHDFINGQPTQYDDLYHGTHIAGIIAAKNNSVGIIGVAPDVDIYACKVLDSTNSGWVDDSIAGIDWAISQGVDIIHFSLVTITYNQLMVDATRRAYNAGIIVVAGTGNGTWDSDSGWDMVGKNYVYCPASDYSCVAVGSTEHHDGLAYYSNYGAGLNCVAPGSAVYSTSNTGGYRTVSGTSFSTAFVTGHLACLKEKYPTYTRQQLVNKLLSSCRSLGDSLYFGAGLVQAEPSSSSLIPPGMVTIIERLEGGFNLAWSPSSGATSYTLAYRWSEDATWYYLTTSVPSCNLLVNRYGRSYELKVRANNASGSSGYSELSIGTTTPKTPYISCIGKSTNYLTISIGYSMDSFWDYVDVDLYKDGVFIQTNKIYYNGKETTFYNLIPGTFYEFRARSVFNINGVDLLSYGEHKIYVWTEGAIPSIPSEAPTLDISQGINGRGEGCLYLTWGESIGATNYTLRYRGYDGTNRTKTGIVGTSYTLSGLEFGVSYALSVKATNSYGMSDYTEENIGTTTAKSPGNLTCPAFTKDTIDIRVADGMAGNWDYIRVYAYNSGISPTYKDITKAQYDAGARIVTWTNLTAGATYKFNAHTKYTYNNTDLSSIYWSNDLYVTTSTRPTDFAWTYPKVSGSNLILTAIEWDGFTAKINAFRTYKGLSTYSFTSAVANNDFTAKMFNQARNTIFDMNSNGIPSTKLGVSDVVNPNDADNVNASDLNALVNCLNSIQ